MRFIIVALIAGIGISADAHAHSTKARAVVENKKCGVLLGLSNGMWGLPGGAIEDGETSEEAALREVREETGLKGTKIVKVSLLGVNEALHSDIYLVQVVEHACESVSHFDDPDQEFSELKWFHPPTLPDNIYPDVVEHIGWFLKKTHHHKGEL